MTWRNRAACLGTDTELFYLPDPAPIHVAAREYCNQCPVAAECLGDALDTGDKWGVRGGLTAEQRAALKKRGRRANPVAARPNPLPDAGRIGAAPGGASTPSEGLAPPNAPRKDVHP